jgi:hypothetical protein
MKPFRRKRRAGNRAPTQAEGFRVAAAKVTACIPCLVWARAGHMPMEHVANLADYNHCKSGNVRRGHAMGYACCGWHHRSIVGEGWTHAQMREHFGPSLMDGSRLFHATYGSDDELIALQSEILGDAAA